VIDSEKPTSLMISIATAKYFIVQGQQKHSSLLHERVNGKESTGPNVKNFFTAVIYECLW
jgi:hypothetical protein